MKGLNPTQPAKVKTFQPCQICGAAPASCKSHIIPRQFYSRLLGDAKHLLRLEVEETIQRGFSQSGIREQGILCPECDGRLGVFDDYAYMVLPARVSSGKTKYWVPSVTVVDMGLIDVQRFKMFLAALLWRASRSTHEMFRHVKLGSFGKRLKGVLTGKDTSWLGSADCVIVHLDPPRYDKILLQPFVEEYDGVRVVRFYLYPWKLLIKLDERPFGPVWQQLILKVGAPTHALVMNDFSRGEVEMLADLQRKIKAHHSARGDGKADK